MQGGLQKASFPMESIELHDFETTWLMAMTPSISSVTFYSGTPPIEFLEQRIWSIIQANPWLTGHLIQHSSSKKLFLQYPSSLSTSTSTSTSTSSFFSVKHDQKLCSQLSYDQLTKKIFPYCIPNGSCCINKTTQSLFSITILVIDHQSFALIFSISHVIADGSTFYTLYRMLSPDQPILPLIPSRDLQFPKKLDQITGGNKIFSWFLALPTTINILLTLLFSPKPSISLNILNPQWITSQKSLLSSSSDTSFISTNDIFTSWFFNICRADVGIMAMNFRNRIPSLTDSHAGNYEALMGYLPSDYHSPSDIRDSLSAPYGGRLVADENPKLGPHGNLPGPLTSISARSCLISSWVRFYHEINLNSFNCQHVLHLPCLESTNVAFQDIGILFCPKQNEIAFLGFTRSYSIEKNQLVIPQLSSRTVSTSEQADSPPVFVRDLFDDPSLRLLQQNASTDLNSNSQQKNSFGRSFLIAGLCVVFVATGCVLFPSPSFLSPHFHSLSPTTH